MKRRSQRRRAKLKQAECLLLDAKFGNMDIYGSTSRARSMACKAGLVPIP
jgi:hypothetical protein